MNIDKNLIKKWKMLFESEERKDNESFLEEEGLDEFRAHQAELLKNVKDGQGMMYRSGTDYYGYYITDAKDVKYDGQEYKSLLLYGVGKEKNVDYDASALPGFVLLISLRTYEVLEINTAGHQGAEPRGKLGSTPFGYYLLEPGEKVFSSRDSNFD